VGLLQQQGVEPSQLQEPGGLEQEPELSREPEPALPLDVRFFGAFLHYEYVQGLLRRAK
jgi:hypothetical protein